MHLMIRPIMPYDIPKLTENPFVLISGFVLVITAVLIAVVLSRYAAEAYKGNRKKATLFFVGITAFVTLVLFCFFGCAATTFKGCIFCLLLLFSSYEDIRVRECEDYVHLMIVIAAFIGTDMDISECVITPSGEREYHTLFRFRITKNELKRGKYKIDGYFEQPEIMSEHLKAKLLQFGVPQKTLEQFLVKDGDFK